MGLSLPVVQSALVWETINLHPSPHRIFSNVSQPVNMVRTVAKASKDWLSKARHSLGLAAAEHTLEAQTTLTAPAVAVKTKELAVLVLVLWMMLTLPESTSTITAEMPS
jgi:hypothetical protein